MDWRGRSGAGAGQEGASSVREEGGPSGVGACEEEVLAWASAERLVPWGLGPPASLLWASCLASARRASFLRPRPPGVNVTDTFPCPRDKAPSFPHPAPPPQLSVALVGLLPALFTRLQRAEPSPQHGGAPFMQYSEARRESSGEGVPPWPAGTWAQPAWDGETPGSSGHSDRPRQRAGLHAALARRPLRAGPAAP